MKNYFLSMILILSGIIFAQNNSLINLKNGSSIRGEIIENDSSHVRIRTKDGSYWNFNQSEISSIESYVANVQSTGFYNRTSVGVLGGDNLGASMRIVNGYSFNRHWETGFGVGIEQLNWNPYVPLFVEGKYSILKGNTRPFISVHSGYLMPLRNFEFNKGGLTTGAELGITHYFSNHLGISTSLGYRFCYLKQQNMWWDDFMTTTQMNRFEIRLGLVFR